MPLERMQIEMAPRLDLAFLQKRKWSEQQAQDDCIESYVPLSLDNTKSDSHQTAVIIFVLPGTFHE